MENLKLEVDHRDEGQSDEQDELEIKVEKFFSLIRSYRDARNRLINIMRKRSSGDHHDQLLDEEEKKKKRMKSERSSHCGWVPSFESEDFTEEVEFRALPLILPNPCNKKIIISPQNNVTQEDPNGLDLNLTL